MKRIFLSILALTLFCFTSCNRQKAVVKNDVHQSATRSSDVDASNNKSAEATVSDFYDVVVNRYMSGKEVTDYDFMDFYSSSFKSLLEKVYRRDSISGDIGSMDFGLWIDAQDYENLSVESVKRLAEEDKATVVEVTLRNCGKESKVYLEMINEKGRWKVDDFRYHLKDGILKVRPAIERYLAKGNEPVGMAK